MADAAARREARKKRILENSDARLQRITGQTGVDRLSEDAPKNLSKSSPSATVNGANSNESVIDSWNILSEFQDEFPSTSQENLYPGNSLNECNVPRRRNLGYTPNGGVQGQVEEDNFVPDRQNTFLSYAGNTPGEPETAKDSNVSSFLASRWLYVALAFLVNIMIVLRTEHLFGTSVIVPFSLILITRMFFCASLHQPPSGSMIFAALILCNIKPEIIHRLRGLASLMLVVIRELSFYLSSFVLIYYFFTSYWQDFEGLAPNKVEVIVDHQTNA